MGADHLSGCQPVLYVQIFIALRAYIGALSRSAPKWSLDPTTLAVLAATSVAQPNHELTFLMCCMASDHRLWPISSVAKISVDSRPIRVCVQQPLGVLLASLVILSQRFGRGAERSPRRHEIVDGQIAA